MQASHLDCKAAMTEASKMIESLTDELTTSEYSDLLDILLQMKGKQLFTSWINSNSEEHKSNVTLEEVVDLMADIIADRDSSSESEISDLTSTDSLNDDGNGFNRKETKEPVEPLKSQSLPLSHKKQKHKTKKLKNKLLLSTNPSIEYGNGRDKRPFIWIYIRRTGKAKGFVKRKYLIDSGAKRSSLYQKDAETLKLLQRGTVSVVNASKHAKRSLVRVVISTGKGKGSGCWKEVTSAVEITCNVRESVHIKRGVLGADWLSLVRPSWP